tara:strand:+ start:285 stop:581 length:297 start_codon:yes stop_codon:yes gene_type:complete
MSSDQRFTTITSTGQAKTISGGSTNMGPCRVTYIQAEGAGSAKLILRNDSSGSGEKLFEADFGTEGLDIYVPGNGIRFDTTLHATLTATGSVTIGYTG